MGAFFNSPIYFRKLSSALIGLNGDMLVTITKFNLLFIKLQTVKNEKIQIIINEILSDTLFQNVFENEIRKSIELEQPIKALILEENKDFMKKEYIEMINVIRKENNPAMEPITEGDLETNIAQVQNKLNENEVLYEKTVKELDNEQKESADTTGGGTRKIRKNKKRTKNRKNKKLKKKSHKTRR
jgi:hypothetical protein